MTFQEKNVTVSLFTSLLVLIYYLSRLLSMVRAGDMVSSDLFRLWAIVIVLVIVFTIAGTVLTHIFSAILEAIRTGTDDPEIEDIADERDKLIDLQGTRVSYFISSAGVFLSMLSFALGRPALTMFALLILVGLLSQIAGDISRLARYRRGF
jgi:hypothetical protein